MSAQQSALCRTRRMGTDKAGLTWGDGTLLAHVVGVMAVAVGGPVVVVHAVGSADTETSDAPTGHVSDGATGRGPLQGIASGLRAAAAHGSTVAFVCSVDLPLIHPAYVGAVLGALGGAEGALPGGHGQRH